MTRVPDNPPRNRAARRREARTQAKTARTAGAPRQRRQEPTADPTAPNPAMEALAAETARRRRLEEVRGERQQVETIITARRLGLWLPGQ